MNDQAPTLQQWRRLYDLAAQLKKIEPWGWLAEDDIFGVRDPENGEIGFVGVMGMLGEHFALAVYLGPRALYQFWDLEEVEDDDELPIEQLLTIPQLQLSFEDRDELEKQDRDVIKRLNLQFRGKNAWPMFRAIHPGFLPWFLEAEEARRLIIILEQALDVLPRTESDEELLSPGDDDITYLVREMEQEDGTAVWRDTTQQIPPPPPEPIAIVIGHDVLEAYMKVPKRKGALELDVFMLPAPIAEPGLRPRFPYVMLLVEPKNGMVLASELLVPDTTLDEMWAEVPARLVEALASGNSRPTEIRISSEALVGLLAPGEDQLGFKLKLVEELPALEAAREALFSEMMGGLMGPEA